MSCFRYLIVSLSVCLPVCVQVKSPEFEKSYELGPGTVCRGIVKRFGKKLEVINVQA